MRSASNGPVRRGSWCNFCGAALAHWNALALWLPHSARELPGAGPGVTWSLCVQCYEERLRCAACGAQVRAHAFTVPGHRELYCRRCFEERPKCDICGRPLAAHPQHPSTRRLLCERCHSTAVSGSARAEELYARVRAAVAGVLGLQLRQACPLKLVDRRQMHRIIARSTLHVLDADSQGRCFGLFVREGSRRAIFVESGLPQITLMEVLAHEYAHAWQSERCPDNLPPEVQEGFAEWVAYKLMEHWGCRRRSERMLRRDDLYGRGLRLMLKWEAEGGAAEVLRRMNKAAAVAPRGRPARPPTTTTA